MWVEPVLAHYITTGVFVCLSSLPLPSSTEGIFLPSPSPPTPSTYLHLDPHHPSPLLSFHPTLHFAPTSTFITHDFTPPINPPFKPNPARPSHPSQPNLHPDVRLQTQRGQDRTPPLLLRTEIANRSIKTIDPGEKYGRSVNRHRHSSNGCSDRD